MSYDNPTLLLPGVLLGKSDITYFIMIFIIISFDLRVEGAHEDELCNAFWFNSVGGDKGWYFVNDNAISKVFTYFFHFEMIILNN